MPIQWGILGACLLLTQNGDPAPPTGTVLGYKVTVLDLKGIDWRGAHYAQLRPIAREGACAVWTTSQIIAQILIERADRVVAAPRVVADPQAPVSIKLNKNHALVGALERVADGPVNHAQAVAYKPEIEHIEESLDARITGRVLDQGILAKIALHDVRLVEIVDYSIEETVKPQPDSVPGKESTKLTAQTQVPLLASGQIEGEWLIPRQEVLVVSLGVAYQTDGAAEKPLLTERLALIEATCQTRPVTPPLGTPIPSQRSSEATTFRLPVPLPSRVSPKPHPTKEPSIASTSGAMSSTRRARAAHAGFIAPLAAMPGPILPPVPSIPSIRIPAQVANASPLPALPSRTMPIPRDHSGGVVPLPPLPPPHDTPVLSDDSVARASSQTPHLTEASSGAPQDTMHVIDQLVTAAALTAGEATPATAPPQPRIAYEPKGFNPFARIRKQVNPTPRMVEERNAEQPMIQRIPLGDGKVLEIQTRVVTEPHSR
jgi:hypothetical protein